MELYLKNSKGQLEEANLVNVLEKAFSEAGFTMDSGEFTGEDHIWVGIVQESKSSQIVTNITFKEDCKTITGLHIYETPIKRVIDEDDSKQLI